MKINPRLFPAIIVTTFLLFLLLALLVGFRPGHEGQHVAVQLELALLSIRGSV